VIAIAFEAEVENRKAEAEELEFLGVGSDKYISTPANVELSRWIWGHGINQSHG
jgi:hypothetical protein